MCRLTSMRRGERGIIALMPQGRHACFRLTELGLHIGQSITVVNVQPLHGPVIVRIGNADIALGYKLADRIMVKHK